MGSLRLFSATLHHDCSLSPISFAGSPMPFSFLLPHLLFISHFPLAPSVDPWTEVETASDCLDRK